MISRQVAGLLTLVLCLANASAAEWQTGFESGLQGVSPYHKTGPQTALSIGTDRPAEGAQYAIGRLPGERRLEGLNVTATGLESGQAVTVTAQVRGRGNLWLCLISGSRWLYSPATVALADEWQTVSLTKTLRRGEASLGIHVITRDIQEDAVFEVDDVRVTPFPRRPAYDCAVPGYRVQAEDYCERAEWVSTVAGAQGGRALSHSVYFRASAIPFPQTEMPVNVWLRVKPASVEEEYRLWTPQGGVGEILSTVKPSGGSDWQWVRMGAFVQGEIGDQFSIDFRPAQGVAEPVALDAVVVSTEDLSAEVLASVAPLVPGYPMTLVSPCAEAPLIDGRGEDPCWAATVACSGFTALRSSVLAEAQTVARFCHDDTHLYLLFECEEPLLKTEMQRRHEFLATVAERDAELYADDCCLVIVDPVGDGKRVYDFTINALGTIQDARCAEPDLWQSRDTGWNSTARAAGHLGEGRWSVEIAIPLSELGVAAPPHGARWNVILGRLAKSRGEQSSWNPSGAGFHAPGVTGVLVFGGPWGGLALTAPDSVQMGANVVTAAVAPEAATGVTVITSVTRGARCQHFATHADLARGSRQIEHAFPVVDAAVAEFAHAVFDSGSLRPLYATSVRRAAATSTVAMLDLDCTAPFRLFLNERKIAEGPRAEAQSIAVALQAGQNVLALALEGGTAAVRITPPAPLPVAPRWKIAPADLLEAIGVGVDDSAWESAPVVGEHPRLGEVLGVEGKPVVLRHTLLWTKTRVWPTPEPALYIARDSAQHITFVCAGIEGKPQRDWSLCLALPEGFEAIGSTGYYANVTDQPQFLCDDLGPQTIDGAPLHVWRVSATKPIRSGRHYIMSLFQVMVRHTGGAQTPAETRFLYWSQGNAAAMTEPAQRVDVRLCEAIRGKQPKTLHLQLWGSFFGSMESEAVRRAALETAQAAGFNDLVSGDRWSGENCREYGMSHTTGFTFAAWSIGLKEFLAEHPRMRLVDSQGNPNDSQMCMSCVLDEGYVAIREKLKAVMERSPAQVYDYDYEFSPFTGHHACYCPRCLQVFRQRAGLPEEGPELTPAQIREQQSDAWVEFMTWRVALLFRKLKDTVHETAPEALFSTYSGYHMPDTAVRYGVDWKLVGDLRACDRVGCGYGRPVPAVMDTIRALQGIPVQYGELVHPYDTSVLSPVGPVLKANLLRRFLDSTGGALVYDRLPLEGRSWHAIGEVSRLVADFEEVFAASERTLLDGVDEASGAVRSHGGTTLLCLLNVGNTAQTYRFRIPAGLGEGTEYYTGLRVREAEPLEVTLPPGEAVAYVFGQ
jgi:hypothetical protein